MVTIVLSPIPSYISWLTPLEASLDFCVATLPVGLARRVRGDNLFIQHWPRRRHNVMEPAHRLGPLEGSTLTI